MEPMQRARSETAKLEREDSILTATEILLRQSGYDSMTMQAVATAAGLAKGTLSIYISPAVSHLFLRFMAGYLIVGLTVLPLISLN